MLLYFAPELRVGLLTMELCSTEAQAAVRPRERISTLEQTPFTMGSDLPMPDRSRLPRVTVTPEEHAARKVQMERILAQAIDDYDRFRTDNRQLNPDQWKLVASRDHAKLYRETEVGSGFRGRTHKPPAIGDFQDLEYKRKLRSMRMVGSVTGVMENSISSLMVRSQEEFEVVMSFLHDDLGDCSIVATMEGPTEERPLHYLGYKWMVKKAPGGGRIIWNRDTVYLEYNGIRTTKSGDKIGYILIESVDVPSFPELPELKTVRAYQSAQFLMVQKKNYVVEIFMTAVIETSIKFVKVLPAEAIFGVTKIMDLAESRKLTVMMHDLCDKRHQLRQSSRSRKTTECSLCQHESKRFSTSSIGNCNVCGRLVCSKCRAQKRLFFRIKLKVEMHRVNCCKQCIIDANQTRLADDGNMYATMGSSISSYPSSSGTRPRSSSDASLAELRSTRSPGKVLYRLHNMDDDSVVRSNRRGQSSADTARRCLESRGDSARLDIVPYTGSKYKQDPLTARSWDQSQFESSPPTVQPSEMYSQMLELCRLADDAYMTTRQNRAFMEQSAVSSARFT